MYWMLTAFFLLGLYLFLQVQYPLSFVSIKFKHFFIFGCGMFFYCYYHLTIPYLFYRRATSEHNNLDFPSNSLLQTKQCRRHHQRLSFLWSDTSWLFCLWDSNFLHPHNQHLLPHMDHGGKLFKATHLVCQKTFLQIVISKLREKVAMDHDKKHFKAAKVKANKSLIYQVTLPLKVSF